MVLNRLVLRRCTPGHILAILIPDAMTPRQIVVHLQKVVVAQDGRLGLHAAEEVHHALLELLAELGDVTGGVDLAERHAEFVLQAPEAGEQDRARQEVVLAIRPLEHDGQVVLHHARGHLHRVLGQGPLGDVEGLARQQIVHADGGGAVERRVALGQVGAKFFDELNGAVEGFRSIWDRSGKGGRGLA